MVMLLYGFLLLKNENIDHNMKTFLNQLFSEESSQNMFLQGIQNDAHEFLLFILNNIDDQITIFRSKYFVRVPSPNEQLNIMLDTNIKCINGHVSTKFSVHKSLQLNIINKKKSADALKEYFSKINLENENAYECVQCRSLVKAELEIKPQNAPNVLILQLLRFDEHLNKLNHHIMIDFNIKYFNQKYELAGIVCHIGSNLSSGHYTSILIFIIITKCFKFYKLNYRHR